MKRNELEHHWMCRLKNDFPHLPNNEYQSLIKWLLNKNNSHEKFEVRYHILRQGYLHCSSTEAYHKLIKRLGALMLLHPQIRALFSSSPDKQAVLLKIIQEVIQKMLKSDRHIQHQMKWIAECTTNEKIRHILLFTALEEYCMSLVGKHPLLINYLIKYLSNNVSTSQARISKFKQSRNRFQQSILNLFKTKKLDINQAIS
ncbi:MAG: hypothetical protein AB4058_21890 [Microcystaceae cyanobacterium]